MIGRARARGPGVEVPGGAADEKFYQDVLDQMSDGVYFVTLDRRITYWNRGAERLTAYSAGEVLGHSCAEGILRHVNRAGRQLCVQGCPLLAVMKDGKLREAQIYLHHKDGQRVPVMVRGQALRVSEGKIVGSMEVFSDREVNLYAGTRQETKDDSLDSVTGLTSRRFGELHLQTLMRAVSEQATTPGVLFMDADHFKDVNDTFGHKTGDAVLRMVGQSLANGLRRGDIAVRWGGEEFVALLPGTKEASLAAVAERVRMLEENSWIQEGETQVRVTVSVGATMAVPGESPEDLADRADRLMYASKRAQPGDHRCGSARPHNRAAHPRHRYSLVDHIAGCAHARGANTQRLHRSQSVQSRRAQGHL